ncbi:MAG: dimethyl sulfoxide reductase anchor subunit [Candidatus Omnitrophica bacterium]|nr:dimethyl sulfoxide reductase anchor subunit [Candidatus Omnitrophota bacterium]
MEQFDILDLLDAQSLPLKNRVDKRGYYAPKESAPSPESFPSSSKERLLIPIELLEEGEQYRFHFDMSRCVGCQCCVVACNEQNNNPASVNWRRVGEIEGGTYPNTKKYHLSMACNHCLDPSCLTGCPTDAYVKLEDGIVKHQAEECIGCGYCTWNCPYGVPQFNPERNIVTKCDMCHNRLKEGQLPACVAACPEEAIQIEKVNVREWRENHTQADAPEVPDSGMTISTTRITLPKDAPESMLRANRHRIEPEKPHTSLIFMTVLTQLATGGFLTLWLGDFLSRFISFLKPLEDFLAFGACGMLAVTGIALFAAIFHLGRPLYAYKALKMWKRSWLSREVLFFALFSVTGGFYAVFQLTHYFFMSSPHVLSGDPFFGFPIKDFGNDTVFKWGMVLLGTFVVIFGLAGVYASAKIYLVPARPSWNTIRTPARFFLTGFILGPLFALAIYAFYVTLQSDAAENSFFRGPIFAFLAISVISGFLQLIVLFSRLFSLRGQQNDELYGSTFLLIHRFKRHFLTRLILLFLGSFVLPFALFHFLTLGNLPHFYLVIFALASFAFSLLGELLGRYLFFVTVVPKNIPGSFFTVNGGAH